MKARTATSGKRLATAAVAGVSIVALLGGCGFSTRQGAAAVVNGHVIPENEVRTTTQQLNDAQLQFTEDVVVNVLIAAPLLEEQIDKSGSWKPDETYAAVMANMPGATETTKDFVAAVALVESGRMTDADVAGYREALKNADISVNPKYGDVIDAPQSPIFFQLGPKQPNWITPLEPAAQ